MHVVLVWPSFQPDNAAGVRGRVLARALAEEGVDVQVVAFPERGATDPVDVGEAAGSVTIDTVPLARDPSIHFFSGRFLLRTVVRSARPDLIVCSTPSALAFVQAESALRRIAPFVADVRDLGAASLAATFGDKPKYRVLHMAEARALRRSREVLAVSEVMLEHLVEDYGVDPARLHLVPNGTDVAAFQSAHGVDKEVDVLFNGAILDEGRRGIETLDAFAKVLSRRPGTRFQFLGWRQNAYAKSLEAHMDAIGIRRAVDLVPPVPFREVPARVARARIGIVPLQDKEVYRMAVGAKTYDYLAAGVPIVTLGPRGDTELRRILDAHDCGIYTEDGDAFADALLALLEDEDQYRTLAKNAYEAGGRYDRKRVLKDAWETILKPLAEAGR